VFFLLQILNNFPVDFDVLEAPMQNDEDLCSDGPVVQV